MQFEAVWGKREVPSLFHAILKGSFIANQSCGAEVEHDPSLDARATVVWILLALRHVMPWHNGSPVRIQVVQFTTNLWSWPAELLYLLRCSCIDIL